jgi:hypothetical protein
VQALRSNFTIVGGEWRLDRLVPAGQEANRSDVPMPLKRMVFAAVKGDARCAICSQAKVSQRSVGNEDRVASLVLERVSSDGCAEATRCGAANPGALRTGMLFVLEWRQHAQQPGSLAGGSQITAIEETGDSTRARRAVSHRLGRMGEL